jgi:hypothetical protein
MVHLNEQPCLYPTTRVPDIDAEEGNISSDELGPLRALRTEKNGIKRQFLQNTSTSDG